MSKIYQALEKAEREREKERELKPEFSPARPMEIEEKKETEVGKAEPPRVVRAVSNPQLVSLFQPGSQANEQFRKLRTHLFRNRTADPPKTILVTSATAGEGKTFVAANLAVGIAQDLHAYALLVDCDLRKPNLSGWFGIDNGKGLSDYLLGHGNLPGLLIRTDVEKLSLLPSGSIQEKSTELIGSKRMEALVQELKARYSDRYIIFDSTPLLATTEPEVLGKLVDGILVVVKAGSTPRETLQHAIGHIEKEKILGIVLNYLNFRSPGLAHRYFGSYRYYYQYGYGSHPSNHRGLWKKMISAIRRSN